MYLRSCVPTYEGATAPYKIGIGISSINSHLNLMSNTFWSNIESQIVVTLSVKKINSDIQIRPPPYTHFSYFCYHKIDTRIYFKDPDKPVMYRVVTARCAGFETSTLLILAQVKVTANDIEQRILPSYFESEKFNRSGNLRL